MQTAPWPFQTPAQEEAFFEAIRQKTNGFIAKNLNKRISIPISRRLLKYPITPNQITCFHTLLGVFALYLVWQATYAMILLGGLLMWFSTVLDGCDGEVARAKNLCTPFGKYFDTVVDTLKSAVYVIVLAFALGRGVPMYTTLGYVLLAGGIYLVSMMVLFSWWSPDLQGSFTIMNSSSSRALDRFPRVKQGLLVLQNLVKNDTIGFAFPVMAALHLNQALVWIAVLAVSVEMGVYTYLWINRKQA